MSWYGRLCSDIYLQLLDNRFSIEGYRITEDLMDGRSLIHPTCVAQYEHVVIVKNNGDYIKLYHTNTDKINEDQYSLSGRIWKTIDRYKFTGSKADFGNQFMVVKYHEHTNIMNMLKNRSRNINESR